MIGGFIITGSDSKRVIIRGIGPSLPQFGVPNVLADPVLELHGPGTFVTITNDNWRDDPVQEALILATGIPPTNDLESAIVATLVPGAYTAIVRGNGNTSGVALVEIYDLNSAANAKLANISTRGFVQTADNVMIGGFVLGGSSTNPAKVVVRALGPSLAQFGINNPLSNPTLQLFNNNGQSVAFNDNWQDDPSQIAELQRLNLVPSNPAESAIVATLPPGMYTAVAAGQGGGIGVGLVEIYGTQ